MKKGYPQNLDNGVLSKPTSPFTGSRTSRDMDFEAIIKKGENTNGQTSITPAEVSRGGQTSGRGYSSYNWGNDTDSRRWNSNPMLNQGSEYGVSVPVLNSKKKK